MFFKFVENFLTKEECNQIIELGESMSLVQMTSSKIVNGKVIESNLEYSGNQRKGCYFVDDTLSLPLIETINKKIVTLSNDLKPFNSIQYTTIPKYSFNRYDSGDFLEWHEDRHEIINGATITYIIQLNDDYQNGLVKYIIEGIEYDVPKLEGSVFIFDSNIMHSVESVTTGHRYSLNVWPSSKKKISLI
jgi:predicted 2-oxoglutarate/Fe(II)-dependent dioxygenase YbiX